MTKNTQKCEHAAASASLKIFAERKICQAVCISILKIVQNRNVYDLEKYMASPGCVVKCFGAAALVVKYFVKMVFS